MSVPPLLRAAHRLYMLQARFTRGMTMGVRAIAIDPAGRVFLVRHTYVAGWHLPGGAVDPGETAEQALHRELREEGNLRQGQAPALHGVFLNRRVSRRDHVLVYVMREAVQTAPRAPDREIAESGFFAPDALPEGTTASTKARLAEALRGAPVSPDW
jgi:ADP-ribose pyrophosphatase YjhB (NUDIX family)